ncbi:UNVERIFIED_CONTAM: hypothetical protein K2H54_038507 [Gekko kuhli]
MPSGADGNFCSPRPPASFSDQASSPSQQPEAVVNALKVQCAYAGNEKLHLDKFPLLYNSEMRKSLVSLYI